MRILLANIPGGPFPSDFAPVGVTRVMEGVDPELLCTFSFLDLDYYRYPPEETTKRIEEFAPHLIGFSASLTTAYSYLKDLSLRVKADFPDTIQVLGGEMSVIARIILLKTAVDFCVVGEAEPTFSRLLSKVKEHGNAIGDREEYAQIKGLVFLQENVPRFTGYEKEKTDVPFQVNYELLSRFTELSQYMPLVEGPHYRGRINGHEISHFFDLFDGQNARRKIAQISASKGCVGKCSFCHRFFKGYSVNDPEQVIRHIDEVAAGYDVGLIQFTDECFGVNAQATGKILDHLKKKGINWTAGAVRARTVKEETVRYWKETGCVQVNYGIESCSQKMLDVMDKRTRVEDNLEAIRLCNKYGLFSIIGLVIGMPGETDETIDETIDNLARVIPEDMDLPYEICINYFQAVPGTQGYEYARRVGYVGNSLEDEEAYLLGLYQVDANDLTHYLNFIDCEKEELAYWKEYILLELSVAYMRTHGVLRTLKRKKANRYRYACIYMTLPRPIRRILLKYFRMIRQFGIGKALSILGGKLYGRRKSKFAAVSGPLRLMNRTVILPVSEDDVFTHVLRGGR